MKTRFLEIVDYDPAWSDQFLELRARLWPTVQSAALAIEHVGSTAVPGLASKPILDLDIVIGERAALPMVAAGLATLGYRHCGNLGIEDRAAFQMPEESSVAHHLYVCLQGSAGLRNHLALREHLRAHPEAVAAYAALKRELARRDPTDIDRYIEGKTAFIVDILAQHGFAAAELSAIVSANVAKP